MTSAIQLPPEIWKTIADFSSSTLEEDINLMKVCSHSRKGVREKWIEWLSKGPKFLPSKKFEAGMVSYHQLVLRIASLPLPFLVWPYENDKSAPLPTVSKVTFCQLIREKSIQDLTEIVSKSDGNQLFINSIIFSDENIHEMFPLPLIAPRELKEGGRICLQQGRTEVFQKIWDTILKKVPDAITYFLIVSGQTKQLGIFKSLLAKGPKSFKANEVLAELACKNSSSEAISLLLASQVPIDQQYLPDAYSWGLRQLKPGLHRAMCAACGGQIEALQALLNGMKGKKIDYRIFQDIIAHVGNRRLQTAEDKSILELLYREQKSRYPQGDPSMTPWHSEDPPVSEHARVLALQAVDAALRTADPLSQRDWVKTVRKWALIVLIGAIAGVYLQRYMGRES